MRKFEWNGTAWKLEHKGRTILECSECAPFLYVGCGQETVDMYRGNYKIEDYVVERRPLSVKNIRTTPKGAAIDYGEISVELSIEGDCAELAFQHCYGCGEQMSYFDMRGRHFPLWTSEPGVGRDKTTYVTWRSDVENKGGGDYYNTYFPQPTYVSSRRYYLHVDSSAYADFDFRNPDFHELQIWEVPASIRIEAAPTFLELLEKESAFFGRQPKLPDWVYNGLIIGVQGGNRTGAANESPALANACNGIGISIRRCTLTCPARLRSSTHGASNSWAISTPIWSMTANCTARAKRRTCLPRKPMGQNIWWTSVNLTALSPT